MCVCVCVSGLSIQPRRVVCRARVRKGAKRRSWPGDVGGGAERAFGSGPLWCVGDGRARVQILCVARG